MINKKRLNELLNDRKTFWADNDCLDGVLVYQNQYKQPLLNALGDDADEVKTFILECGEEDLLYMTELFEDIYDMFPTDDMWDFLDEMEIKAKLHD